MTFPDYSKGVMVALYPSAGASKKVAIDHENALAPKDMHVTLAYIGTKGEDGVPDQEDWPELQNTVREVAQRHAPVEADMTGTCRFTPGDEGTPFVGIVGSHTIHQVRQDLVDRLKAKGIPVAENFSFVPHTTLTYLDKDEEAPRGISEPVPLELSPHLVVEYGEQQTRHPFATSEAKVASWVKEARLYYRDEGLSTFHISAEDDDPGNTVCGQPLPRGDIYLETPPKKDICRVCALWHDREIAKNMQEYREDEIAEQKADYHPPTPPSLEDQHQPAHEYVGNIGEIGYHLAKCKCGWTSNVRSEQAANNAWQRHFDGLNESGRRDKAGDPSYVHPSPKTKRWGSADDGYFDQPNHDYDPSWDYEVDDAPHPAVVAAVEATRPKLEETARHLGMGRPTIHYVKLPDAVAKYAYGTAPHPALMVDSDAHQTGVGAEDLHEAVHDSLFHEFAHGVQDWLGNEQMDEDEAESFARAVSATGDHKARASELEAGLFKRQSAWMDQVTRPYQDEAIADPNPSMEPVMPPLYEQGMGVWPDDTIEQNLRTTKPVDVFSGPKTGAEHLSALFEEFDKSASQTRTCVRCQKVFDVSQAGEATGFCGNCREAEGMVTHHTWSEESQKGHYGAAEDDLTKKTPAEIDNEYFPLAYQHDNHLNRALQYNQLVNDPKTMDYSRQSYRETRDKHRAQADEIKQQMLPHEAEFQRRGGWDRFQWCTSDGGHLHKTNPTCHTLTPGKSMVSRDPDASGLDEPALIEKYGFGVCTHCFKGAPTHPAYLRGEAEAQAAEKVKQDAKCPMSGVTYSPKEHGGDLPPSYWSMYIRPHVRCPGCGKGVPLTDSAKFRSHKPPTTASIPEHECKAGTCRQERWAIKDLYPYISRNHLYDSASDNDPEEHPAVEQVQDGLWSDEKSDRDPIEMIEGRGRSYVSNGNHRLWALKWHGGEDAEANVHIITLPGHKGSTDKSKKRVIMSIGIPGSGKSTVMKPYAQALGAEYVSSDDIREEVTGDPSDHSKEDEVWAKIHQTLHEAIDRNDTVVYDSTGANYELRQKMVDHLRQKAGTVMGIHFDVPLDVAHERNENRDRRVPAETIDNMHAQLEANPPGNEFDHVERVVGSDQPMDEDSAPDRGIRSARLASKREFMKESADFKPCRFCLASGLNGGVRCGKCAATGSEGTVPCGSCGTPLRAFEVFVASGPSCASCLSTISV